MITGYNANVRHGERLFHVQTEDSGRAHPHVITHLYYEGTILASEKREYAELLDAPDLVARVRRLMEELTPLVEPISIDEAFMDLSGTEQVHKAPPALALATLQKRIEDTMGITVSIGLSFNKFLAKIASDMRKPRGYAVIGEAEAVDFLADKPVGLVYLGLASPQRTTTREIHFGGDSPRDVIRDRAAKAALNMLRLVLLGMD